MWAVRPQLLVVLTVITVILLLLYHLLLHLMSLDASTPTPAAANATEIDTVEDLVRRDFLSQEWETCNAPEQLPVLFNNDIWQHPFDSSYYALAAYPDRRLRMRRQTFPYVRVIAMRDGYHSAEIHCQLQYDNLTESVPAQVDLVWEPRWDPQNVGRLYDPVLVSCPLRTARPMPQQVALTPAACGPADTALTVDTEPLRQMRRTRSKRAVAVCVKGLDFAVDISGRLVEWIEMQRLLGADQIFFYRFHTHERVTRVLEHYSALGVATVVNMTLPGFQPNYAPDRTRYLRAAIWQKRRNELVHYNDCLYRNLYRYRYVVPLDIDEVIVPMKYRTWVELLDHLEEVNPVLPQRFASLSVRHVYVFDNMTQEPDPSLPERFHILRHTERATNASGRGYSSKSFVSTRGALTVFNHYAMQPLYPEMDREARVVPAQALLYHYKSQCPEAILRECRENFNKFTQTDHSLERYRDELVSAVNKAVTDIGL